MTSSSRITTQTPILASLVQAIRTTGSSEGLANVAVRLAFVAAGFGPITALATAIVGVTSLRVAVLSIVVPTALAATFLGIRFPAHGRLALRGLLIGLAAVFVYDLFRLPFVLAGIWPDFIPRIGGWFLETATPNAAVGYVYRYLGDGAGMGMAFVVAYPMLRRLLEPVCAAIAFGVAVWLCLIATLLVAPHGQELLFRITPTSLALSLAGHLIYGEVIGFIVRRGDRAPESVPAATPMGVSGAGIRALDSLAA